MHRSPLAAIALLGLTIGCTEPVPTAPRRDSPAFDIATSRLVVQGPFSLRPRTGGNAFWATNINDRGDIIGFLILTPPSGGLYAFLPGAGGPPVPSPEFDDDLTSHFGLNQLGIAAGVIAGVVHRPFLWAPGIAPVVGPSLPGSVGGAAPILSVLAVNDGNVVVGSYGDDVSITHPFRWSPSGLELLDEAGAQTGHAVGINNSGTTVGFLTGPGLPDPHFFGAIWSSAGGPPSLIPNSLLLRDINEAGFFVGESSALCPTLWDASHTILWQGPCGPLGALANRLNDMGHVLYRSIAPGDPVIRPRLRVEGFEPVTLPAWPVAGRDLVANDLNNLGTIVGYSRDPTTLATEPLYWTYTIEPIPPDALLEDLADAVDEAEAGGAIESGNATALRAKLDAASRHLAAGRCEAAENVIRAFLNQVDALESTGRISPATAAELRAAAEAAIAGIEAECE